MKTITLIFVAILILGVPTLFAEDERKEIPIEEAMKAYCGTWVNKDYSEHLVFPVVYINNPDGTIFTYSQEDYDPNFPKKKDLSFTITEAWADSEGHIWIKSRVKGKYIEVYYLNKFSDSGRTWEHVYHSEDYPTEIPQDHPLYNIHYRK